MGPVARTAAGGLLIVAVCVAGTWDSGGALRTAVAGVGGVLVAVAIIAYAHRGRDGR